ncbi:MAG TPA: NADH-quinone oxidoreductase subunit G [Mycobacteriales bacterium]
MTLTPTGPGDAVRAEDLVACTIDGIPVSVPKGTLIIRAAETIGTQIPRFCDHPLLAPVAACRQCLVEVEGQRKPVASCAVEVTPDMVVKTQLTSPVAEKAQAGQMEFLLINHPLDCPVCDKGGECPLQNQAMSSGRPDTRFYEAKRVYPKPLAISSQVLLDRDRCVLCARCTRFSEQIAGDPFIELFERSALEQVGIAGDEPFASYFSGNTVQICPVGALTGATYRFRARPFDLQSTPSVCEHCASGCAQRSDHRRGKITRRLAGDDPAVNEEWNCDKGRWAFMYATQPDRLTTPMVRDANGELAPASWNEALRAAAAGLAAARNPAVLAGGRVTVEDAYAYGKFARVSLRTDSVDFRARPATIEEAQFLGHAVAGTGLGVTYADLEAAPAVALVAFEPEEESPIVFLRLRKAYRARGLSVLSIAPFATRGLQKVGGKLLCTVPGQEPAALDALELPPGSILLAGERLGAIQGGPTAAIRAAARTGARLAWVPRRAGERGALEAGLLPGRVPGGDAARVAQVWGVDALPSGGDGVDTMFSARHDAYVVGGVDLDDLADPEAARTALSRSFVVSLELRPSTVTSEADVVLPVAAAAEKDGTFVDWEGRLRQFVATLPEAGTLPDLRVLSMLADVLERPITLPDVEHVRVEMNAVTSGAPAGRDDAPGVAGVAAPAPDLGQAVLATHHHLLDEGSLQDGELNLAGTRPASVARVSAATAGELDLADGDAIVVSSARGEITLPVALTDLPDRVVWVPTASAGSHVRRALAAVPGDVVSIRKGAVA